MEKETFEKLKTTKLDFYKLIFEFKGDSGDVTFCTMHDILHSGIPFDGDEGEEMQLVSAYIQD